MQTKVIRIGTVGVALRYVYVNVDGDIDGSQRELYDDLCRRARLEYSRVTYECVSAIASLAAGD